MEPNSSGEDLVVKVSSIHINKYSLIFNNKIFPYSMHLPSDEAVILDSRCPGFSISLEGYEGNFERDVPFLFSSNMTIQQSLICPLLTLLKIYF